LDSTRRTAFIVGLLFIITFITSIPAALNFYSDVLENVSKYIGHGGKDMAVPLGALLEMILTIANIGTALWLFPILKRQREALALGSVAARIIESHRARARALTPTPRGRSCRRGTADGEFLIAA
jgi:hypothetical protein